MTQKDKEFSQLVEQARAGSKVAAQELHDMFQSRVFRAVRRRLPQVLRSKYDSQDFAQDIWLAFWQRHRDDCTFHQVAAFGAYLTRMAECVMADAIRQRLGAAKYNAQREQPLDPSNGNHRAEIQDHHSTPSQALIRQEEWRRFIDKQPAIFREILTRYMQGKHPRVIADELDLSRRTVDRALSRLRENFRRSNLSTSD